MPATEMGGYPMQETPISGRLGSAAGHLSYPAMPASATHRACPEIIYIKHPPIEVQLCTQSLDGLAGLGADAVVEDLPGEGIDEGRMNAMTAAIGSREQVAQVFQGYDRKRVQDSGLCQPRCQV